MHLGHRTTELEEEMLSVAEEHLADADPDGRRRLWIWAHEQDELRKDILTRHGYTRDDEPEYQRRRPVSGDDAEPIPDVALPEGYTVRALGDLEDLPARSYVSWRAFHPDEPDDQYEGWEWYRNVQRAPLYRRDLDLVAVAPDGEFASFCTVWFDDVTRTGAFEPVGTAPAHQRRGLGKAVLCEGLRRLKWLGATLAYVGSYTPAAHALYASVGFKEYDVSEPWRKDL
jgi:ribosomal protein S18 acetylase RimI-like enzyme